MSDKNFDRVFFFTYSPPIDLGRHQGILDIDVAPIRSEYDIVDIKQSVIDKKVVVTLFGKKK